MIRLEFRKLHWWYWTASWILVLLGLAGNDRAFQAVTVLAAVQIVHYRILEGSFTAFAVQVRAAVFLIFLAGLFFPVIFWLPAIGLFARITVSYCLTARLLKLLPWNRKGSPLTADFVRQTIFSPPTQGPI